MTLNPMNAFKITIFNKKTHQQYKNTFQKIQTFKKQSYYISIFHNSHFIYFLYYVYYIYILYSIYFRYFVTRRLPSHCSASATLLHAAAATSWPLQRCGNALATLLDSGHCRASATLFTLQLHSCNIQDAASAVPLGPQKVLATLICTKYTEYI